MTHFDFPIFEVFLKKMFFRPEHSACVPRTSCFNPGVQRYFLRRVTANFLLSITLKLEGDRVTVEFELELATTVMKCFFYYKVCLLLLLMHVASVLTASSGCMQFCVVFGPRRPSTSKTWRGLRVATKEDQEWHKWPLCRGNVF